MDLKHTRSRNTEYESPNKATTFDVRREMDNSLLFEEAFSPLIDRDMFLLVGENDLQPEKKKRRKKHRTPWTSQEDAQLVEIVRRFKIEDEVAASSMNQRDVAATWNSVAEQLPTKRTGKQCRDRWINSLRPGLKKGGWTPAEANLIRELFAVFGPRWSAMAKLFPNRTDNDIKNKFYAMKRKDERMGIECLPASLTASLAAWKGGNEEDMGVSCSIPTDGLPENARFLHSTYNTTKKSTASLV